MDLVLYITPPGPPGLQITWMSLQPSLDVDVPVLEGIRVGLQPLFPGLPLPFLTAFRSPTRLLARLTCLGVDRTTIGAEEPPAIVTLFLMRLNVHEDLSAGTCHQSSLWPPQKSNEGNQIHYYLVRNQTNENQDPISTDREELGIKSVGQPRCALWAESNVALQEDQEA